MKWEHRFRSTVVFRATTKPELNCILPGRRAVHKMPEQPAPTATGCNLRRRPRRQRPQRRDSLAISHIYLAGGMPPPAANKATRGKSHSPYAIARLFRNALTTARGSGRAASGTRRKREEKLQTRLMRPLNGTAAHTDRQSPSTRMHATCPWVVGLLPVPRNATTIRPQPGL